MASHLKPGMQKGRVSEGTKNNMRIRRHEEWKEKGPNGVGVRFMGFKTRRRESKKFRRKKEWVGGGCSMHC